MCTNEKLKIEETSILKMILLFLIPGLSHPLFIIIFSSPVFGINIPVIYSLLLSTIFGLIPIELGIMKFMARKENKKIKEIILFKNKTPIKRLLVSVIIPFLFAGIVFAILPKFEINLWEIFGFIPDWFRLDKTNWQEINYLKILVILIFLFDGFLVPIVEELYFRGYLLPRMNRFGKFAPLINTTLFSLYHLFTPGQIITRVIGITPMVYSVWINKDIRIGMIVHCLLNIVGNIGLVMLIFAI
jgi:membrane protease YdiL (CAAX protease family)